MAFKSISETKFYDSGLDFNSAISSNFKDLYDNIVYKKYKAHQESKPSRTFAPSSFRCDRLSFFRLRGVDPDPITDIDASLEFSAILGTACHLEIQRNLKESIGDQWVPVSTYLETHPISYEYKINNVGEFETQLEFFNPPVKFSCDGIIKIGDDFYLLEIKSSEYQSFKNLRAPKDQHIDQVKCYCSLLDIHKALVLYIDRSFGNTKCFEVTIQNYEIEEIFNRMNRVLKCVESNIAPPKLTSGDFWCTYCKYKQRCKQWG